MIYCISMTQEIIQGSDGRIRKYTPEQREMNRIRAREYRLKNKDKVKQYNNAYKTTEGYKNYINNRRENRRSESLKKNEEKRVKIIETTIRSLMEQYKVLTGRDFVYEETIDDFMPVAGD